MLATLGVLAIVWAVVGFIWWPWGVLGGLAVGFDVGDFFRRRLA